MNSFSAEYIKFLLEHIKFRSEMIRIYSSEYTLDRQQDQVERLDQFLIEQMEMVDQLLELKQKREKEAV